MHILYLFFGSERTIYSLGLKFWEDVNSLNLLSLRNFLVVRSVMFAHLLSKNLSVEGVVIFGEYNRECLICSKIH